MSIASLAQIASTPTLSARRYATAATTVALADHREVTLRGGQADDAAELGAMHRRCSPEALYRRYHSAMPRPTGRFLTRLLSTDIALVALSSTGAIVALGNLAADEDDRAEIALLVEDAWQHRGLGKALLAQLVATARLLHYREARLVCLPAERWGIDALSGLGDTGVSQVPTGQLLVTLPLAPHHVGHLRRPLPTQRRRMPSPHERSA